MNNPLSTAVKIPEGFIKRMNKLKQFSWPLEKDIRRWKHLREAIRNRKNKSYVDFNHINLELKYFENKLSEYTLFVSLNYLKAVRDA